MQELDFPPDIAVTQNLDGEVSIQDGQVVVAVQQGDPEAFRILVRRYQDRYTRFAVRMLGSHDDADDALQTAFVRAYRKIDQCQDPDRFGAWLYQIVINECRTLSIRRSHRERRMVREPGTLEQMISVGQSPDVMKETAPFRTNVQGALDQLNPSYREAFILKYIEELSYEEMSELTGTGISALKMRVKRASDRLRILLPSVLEHER